MNEFIQTIKIVDWLKDKLIRRKCGIIFEPYPHSSFDCIQNIIESYDQPFQTFIIYYQAFAQESAFQFLDTLGEELASKMGNSVPYKRSSLLDIIEKVGLKMIVIDDCHFCDQDTLEQLLNLFYDCGISIILVGDRQAMKTSKVFDHPLVCQWDSLDLDRLTEI